MMLFTVYIYRMYSIYQFNQEHKLLAKSCQVIIFRALWMDIGYPRVQPTSEPDV